MENVPLDLVKGLKTSVIERMNFLPTMSASLNVVMMTFGVNMTVLMILGAI